MLESETINQQLQTNKIYGVLREILEFYLNIGFEENILDVDDYVIALFKDGSHDEIKPPQPSIDIFNIDENAGRINFGIINHNTIKEWMNISVSRKVGNGKFLELDFDGPTHLVQDIYSDRVIKNIIRQDFYNFLLNLNVDMVKVSLI